MDNHNNQQRAAPTIRIKHIPVTENELRTSLFRLFDLLELDEGLVPPRLQKSGRGLPLRQKGVP
jgi:hypothetical protein